MRHKPIKSRFKRFIGDVIVHTPFIKMLLLMIVLWVLFSVSMYFIEHDVEGAQITSIGAALYWGVAAFSTAGIADAPKTGLAQLIGGIWIVLGSVIFFGSIVATITTYFMRPMQRPAKRIIETIEYNLEQMDDLSIDELDLLKETVDTLIGHIEGVKINKEKIKHGKEDKNDTEIGC